MLVDIALLDFPLKAKQFYGKADEKWQVVADML